MPARNIIAALALCCIKGIWKNPPSLLLQVESMKEYDLIVVGTGSAMNVVGPMIEANPEMKVAVIDKDEPGGICLTRGCIPSKLLLYPAELVRTIEKAEEFGINIELRDIDFTRVMERMRHRISEEIETIRRGLSSSPNIDYYPTTASFTAPYTMKVGEEVITSKMIFLCTGSKPAIPAVKGLEETGYHTSDSVLKMNRLPESLAIIGGGYIAAEYGHFFSAMGSKVTIIGRNPRFLPSEEPEISALAKKEMLKHMDILTDHEVVEVMKTKGGKKIIAQERSSGKRQEVIAEEILVAAGRRANTDILHPEAGGIHTDPQGWIVVNEYLETSQRGVWAFGDANGKHLFKHVANYESLVAYYNAVHRKGVKVDYHAVPHAVFSHPEIAAVGMREREAVEKYGEEKLLIGVQRYQDTAKGQAMDAEGLVKVIVERDTFKILGAHIIGPQASLLLQEIVNLMYTPEQTAHPVIDGMHIHPALSEVVERAFYSLMPPEQYHHVLREHFDIEV
jgi:dihydrolipoamide dehydrogenase